MRLIRARGMRNVFSSLAATAALTAPMIAAPDFKKDIQPLLENYCTSCHDDSAKGGLNLEAQPR